MPRRKLGKRGIWTSLGGGGGRSHTKRHEQTRTKVLTLAAQKKWTKHLWREL